jgi:hypothetical protein
LAAPPSTPPSEFILKDSSGCSGLVVSVVIESTHAAQTAN